MEFELEGYKIGGRLSDNKQVTVYRAVTEKTSIPVVIKAMRVFSKTRVLTAKRVRDQQQKHPLSSVVEPIEIRTIPSSDAYGFSAYIVSEYVAGGNLRDHLGIPRGPEEALFLTRKIALALGELYGWAAQHLSLHGNLHPGNVLFLASDQIVLADICPHNTEPSATAIPYLSPEQVKEILHGQDKGTCVDFRSDFFSLGTLLFEMLTGKKAFPVEDLAALEVLHNNQRPQLPSQLSDLQPFLNQLLAKDPEDRFSSDQELLKALDRLSESYPLVQEEEPELIPSETESVLDVTPTDQTVEKPTRSPSAKGILLSSGLALAALGSAFFFFSTQEPTTTAQNPSVSPAQTGEELGGFLLQPPEQQPTSSPDGEHAPRETPVKPEAGVASLSPENLEALRAQQRLQQIEHWMKTAQNYFAADQLLSPEGENAYFAYQQVLRLYPEHGGAQQGLQAIGDRLTAQARTLFEQGKLEQSLAEVNRGLGVLPKHAGLLELQREIQAAKTRAEQIAALLAAGDQQLSENRLSRPPGNNALESYREVLKLDPENEQAKAGITAIADRYQQLAQSALDRKDYKAALAMSARGLEIRDQHAGLLEIQDKAAQAWEAQRRAEERRRQQIAARKARERAERERKQQEYLRRLAEEKKRQQAERARREQEQAALRRAEEERRQQQQAVQPQPEPKPEPVKKPEIFPSF